MLFYHYLAFCNRFIYILIELQREEKEGGKNGEKENKKEIFKRFLFHQFYSSNRYKGQATARSTAFCQASCIGGGGLDI